MVYTTPARNEDLLERQAAEALHVEIIPGTEVMRDVDDIHFTHAKGSETVLIPHPSTSLEDPLNWSLPWKYLALTVQFLFTFVSVESALSVAPMFPLLAATFHLDTQQLSLLTGLSVIMLGYANFVIVPCSNIFGRRFTSIVFAALSVGTSIWEAEAKTHGSLVGARIMNGFATATAESIMMQVVADLFFLHERGRWTGVYFFSYFFGLFIGPIISGNIANVHGWRSFFWLSTGLAGFNLLTIIFGFPETKYHRDALAAEEVSTSTQNIPEDKLGEAQMEQKTDNDLSQTQSTATANIGRGRPSKRQWSLIGRPDPRWKQFLVRDLVSPIRVFFYPIIFWAGLMVGGSANLLLLWNLTESAVLSAPPYNWNPSQVGYSNFAFVVGGLVGLISAGPVSDWVAQRATKRNDGIREAEMRLPALIPYVILSGVGLVIGGLGYDHHWPWEAILSIGYAFIGLSVTTVPTIAIAYAVDCYKPITGEIMVVATVLKNTTGFSMSYWVSTLAAKEGYISPAMVELALLFGPALLGIPLYFYGKSLRRLTKDSPMHRMELVQ